MDYKVCEIDNGRIYRNIVFSVDYNVVYDDINHFTSWPVVYIIYNKNKELAYVGETVDLKTRLMQHFQDPKKSELIDNNTRVMFIDYNFANKSTCLDLESFLIYNMQSDGNFTLLNGNGGLQKYDYYKKTEFESFCECVWNKLFEINMVKNDFNRLQNKKFKYNPYIALNQEQNYIVKRIIRELTINDKKTIFVNGDVGTGKTAVAIHLLKLLKDYTNNSDGLILEDMVDERIDEVIKIIKYFSRVDFKIGIIFPMRTIFNIANRSIKDVFKGTGINVDFVFQPMDAVKYYAEKKEKFDILIVDEAHSLTKENQNDYSEQQEEILRDLNLSNKIQLDWIYEISKKQVFFYDDKQRIRKSYIEPEDFINIRSNKDTVSLNLTVQERCLNGGDDYINCIRKIFNSDVLFTDDTINQLKDLVLKINNKKGKNSYKFCMYNDITKMTNEIKRLFDDDKNKQKGKCYTLSSLCWQTDHPHERDIIYEKYKPSEINSCEEKYNEFFNEILEHDAYSISIGDYKNIFNYPTYNWVGQEYSCRNQVGCIHVIAGLDAEYVGVIIGNDLILENGKLKGIREKFFDKGKNNASLEETFEFILDTYYVLCSRARRGHLYTYVILL